MVFVVGACCFGVWGLGVVFDLELGVAVLCALGLFVCVWVRWIL